MDFCCHLLVCDGRATYASELSQMAMRNFSNFSNSKLGDEGKRSFD